MVPSLALLSAILPACPVGRRRTIQPHNMPLQIMAGWFNNFKGMLNKSFHSFNANHLSLSTCLNYK